MRCPEARKFLSDYNDGLLPRPERTALEEHLSACGACRNELQGLRTYLKELKTLKPVEAPPGFAAQVKQRIQNTPFPRRVLRRIFFPLSIKLPFELAGAAAAAVLLVYLFGLRETKPEPRMPETLVAGRTAAGADEMKLADSAVLSAEAERESDAVRKTAGAPLLGSKFQQEAFPETEPPIRLAMILNPATTAPSGAVQALSKGEGKGNLARGVSRETGVPAEMVALDAAEIEPVSPAPRTLIEEAIAEAGGKVRAGKPIEGKDERPSIFFEIPSGSYLKLLNRLQQFGCFASPPPAELPGGKGLITIRLELLPTE